MKSKQKTMSILEMGADFLSLTVNTTSSKNTNNSSTYNYCLLWLQPKHINKYIN